MNIADFFAALKEHVTCPFCPLLVEEELWNPVGYDFFGAPATVEGVACCDDCAAFVHVTGDPQWLLDQLKVPA